MYVGVSDKARKITIGFGKMEAIGDFVKNSFSGVMEWVGVRTERVRGWRGRMGSEETGSSTCRQLLGKA